MVVDPLSQSSAVTTEIKWHAACELTNVFGKRSIVPDRASVKLLLPVGHLATRGCFWGVELAAVDHTT